MVLIATLLIVLSAAGGPPVDSAVLRQATKELRAVAETEASVNQPVAITGAAADARDQVFAIAKQWVEAKGSKVHGADAEALEAYLLAVVESEWIDRQAMSAVVRAAALLADEAVRKELVFAAYVTTKGAAAFDPVVVALLDASHATKLVTEVESSLERGGLAEVNTGDLWLAASLGDLATLGQFEGLLASLDKQRGSESRAIKNMKAEANDARAFLRARLARGRLIEWILDRAVNHPYHQSTLIALDEAKRENPNAMAELFALIRLKTLEHAAACGETPAEYAKRKLVLICSWGRANGVLDPGDWPEVPDDPGIAEEN